MAKVFIIGSSRGLGLMTGHLLAEQGHAVVLHARTDGLRMCNPAARDPGLRDRLLDYRRDVSGVALEENGTRPRSAPRTQHR